jgi:hypothetical protein
MVVVSPFDGLERQLANRSDTVTVTAKFLSPPLNVVSGTTSTLGITPENLGDRLAALAKLYARFRILKWTMGVVLATSSVPDGTPIVFGIQDDVSTEGGSVPQPTTFDDIFALRCSAITSVGTTLRDPVLYWKPADLTRWYYTNQGSSGTETRLVYPGTLCVQAGTSISAVSFCMYYTIQFSGAQEVPGG